jgi:bis(5'-nucleosyl)-tetraphosphatase (symmetrical)
MTPPDGTSPQHVFVGDVQGCADEFEELLARLRNRFGDEFVLHSVGDLVNRGPDNLRVLESMRELVEGGRGHHVLGNHELGLIAVLLGLREVGERDTLGDVLESAEAPEWLDWLRGRPVVERGELSGQAYVLVHASVHPDWSVADCEAGGARVHAQLAQADLDAVRRFLRQDPAEVEANSERDLLARLVSCRGVSGAAWSSQKPAEPPDEPWHRAWGRRAHDYGVVYGHWATQGLHLAPGLRGLDTGCVHHGRGRDGFLTAWLPALEGEPDGLAPFDVPAPVLWQIPARRRYYFY